MRIFTSDELVAFYNSGHTIKECAAEFGVTQYRVTCVLTEHSMYRGYVRRYSEYQERHDWPQYYTKDGKKHCR